jgi:hypothetical protein
LSDTRAVKKLDLDGLKTFLGQEIKDPFDSFGYGIVSYFSLLRHLMCIFFVISIVMIPVYVIYYNGGEFDGHEKSSSNIPLHSFSIGNLG